MQEKEFLVFLLSWKFEHSGLDLLEYLENIRSLIEDVPPVSLPSLHVNKCHVLYSVLEVKNAASLFV